MVVTLYTPGQPPKDISPDGFSLPNPASGFAQVTTQVALELGCAEFLVDVLDCGPDFVAYTIFDYEGEVNHEGTLAVQRHSKHPTLYGSDDDATICGPLLLVAR